MSVDRIRDGPERRRAIYSVPCDAYDSRASCTSVLEIGSCLPARLDLRSSVRVGWVLRAAWLALLAVTVTAARGCAPCYGFSHRSKTAFKSVSSR